MRRWLDHLSKYISKAFDLDSFTGRYRYRCSKHIEIAKRMFYLPYANGAEAYLIKELITQIAGVDVAYMWQAPGPREHYGWAYYMGMNIPWNYAHSGHSPEYFVSRR